jgi:hypothetical protein
MQNRGSTLLALFTAIRFCRHSKIQSGEYMRKKNILSLSAAFCLSFSSLVSGQEAAAVPPNKAALLAAEQAAMKRQDQVNTEKGRIIKAVGRLPKNQSRKAGLANQVKNSLILQQARDSEGGGNQVQSLRKANSDTAASTSALIARINRLPAAERKHALREAMQALKGRKVENAKN